MSEVLPLDSSERRSYVYLFPEMPRPRVQLRYDRQQLDFAIERLGLNPRAYRVLRLPTLAEGRAWAAAAAIDHEWPLVDLTDCQEVPSELREIPA